MSNVDLRKTKFTVNPPLLGLVENVGVLEEITIFLPLLFLGRQVEATAAEVFAQLVSPMMPYITATHTRKLLGKSAGLEVDPEFHIESEHHIMITTVRLYHKVSGLFPR